MYKKIASLANEYQIETIENRRFLHKQPELGWLEMKTTCFIADYLTDLGYPIIIGRDLINLKERMGVPSTKKIKKAYEDAKKAGCNLEILEQIKDGATGVAAILDCGPGPVIAMRFDIDAVGCHEDHNHSHYPTNQNFCSLNHDTMHSCGHDGHMAIGLTTAKILMDIKDQLHGTIKLIFQPAEEGVRGAKAIVKKGLLDDVDYLYACHIFPRQEDQKDIDVYLGMNESFATTKLDVIYHGYSTHAATLPQFGRNAILSASACITNLHSIPRNSDGCTRVNVGTIHAGTSRNIVPESAKLEIEVRGATTTLNRYMEVYARDIIQGAAMMHDTDVEVIEMGKAYSLNCDEQFMSELKEIITQEVPSIRLGPTYLDALNASDDFSSMMHHVEMKGGKATYMKLLSDCTSSLHSPLYDFDENTLLKGTILFPSIAYGLLQKK